MFWYLCERSVSSNMCFILRISLFWIILIMNFNLLPALKCDFCKKIWPTTDFSRASYGNWYRMCLFCRVRLQYPSLFSYWRDAGELPQSPFTGNQYECPSADPFRPYTGGSCPIQSLQATSASTTSTNQPWEAPAARDRDDIRKRGLKRGTTKRKRRTMAEGRKAES